MKETYFSNIQCNRPTVSTCTTFLYKATRSESFCIGEIQHRCYTQLWRIRTYPYCQTMRQANNQTRFTVASRLVKRTDKEQSTTVILPYYSRRHGVMNADWLMLAALPGGVSRDLHLSVMR